MMKVLRPHFAWLYLLVAIVGIGQSPQSVTYLRLSPGSVESRLQLPAGSEDWSDALRKQDLKAGIPAYQIVEQTVPGSSQRMIMCTIKGRGENVIVVSASLTRPKDDDAANIAWASLAMLPLLAESLNSVSTESSILFVAFPDEERRHSGSARYVQQLSDVQRKNIKPQQNSPASAAAGPRSKPSAMIALLLIGWPRRRLRFSFPRHGQPANMRRLTSPEQGPSALPTSRQGPYHRSRSGFRSRSATATNH